MSQIVVERVIGLLATDEALRRCFVKDPRGTLHDLTERGHELTDCERWALASLDPIQLVRFAEALDGRLQRADLKGGCS